VALETCFYREEVDGQFLSLSLCYCLLCFIGRGCIRINYSVNCVVMIQPNCDSVTTDQLKLCTYD